MIVETNQIDFENMDELEKQIIIKGILNYPNLTKRVEFNNIPNNLLDKALSRLQHSDPQIISEIKFFSANKEVFEFSIASGVIQFLHKPESNIQYKKIHDSLKLFLKKRSEIILEEFESRILEYNKYQRKMLKWSLIFFLVPFFICFLGILPFNILSSPLVAPVISIFCLLPFLLFLLFFVLPNTKKRDAIELKQKEKFAYYLIKIASLVDNFIGDRKNTHFDEAKKEVEYLLKTIPSFVKSYGYNFEEEMINFYDVLEFFIKKYLRKKLDSERGHENLTAFSNQLRKIALMINDEKLSQATEYINKDLGMEKYPKSQITQQIQNIKLFFSNQRSEIIKWLLSIIILILIVLTGIYSLSSFGLIDKQLQVNWWQFLIGLAAIAAFLTFIKKSVNKVFEFYEKGKK